MKHGFSLVELSIVLVILGLLTGGILAGQSLIKAAELRKVTTQISTVHTAIYTFRDKYFALPGDMTNAFQFWGTQAGCTNSVVTTTPFDGCNGNGDGIILDNGANGGEDLRAVQFMALAGLIEGTYTGLPAPSGNVRQGGVNVIRSAYRNAVIWLNELGTANFGQIGNNILVGLESATSPGTPIFRPEELWNIDSKMDDGKPTTGVIIAVEGQTPGCYGTTEYSLNVTGNSCTLIYWLR